jgi:hypothetical protein
MKLVSALSLLLALLVVASSAVDSDLDYVPDVTEVGATPMNQESMDSDPVEENDSPAFLSEKEHSRVNAKVSAAIDGKTSISSTLRLQLTALASKLGKHAPELQNVLLSSKALAEKGGEGYDDLKDILTHVDRLENKLRTKEEKERVQWGKDYKMCWRDINAITRDTSNKISRIEFLDRKVKTDVGYNTRDRERIERSELSELRIVNGSGKEQKVDGLVPMMRKKDDDEDKYRLKSYKRQKQIAVLGIAVTLVCGFRTFVKDPYCVWLKDHPEVLQTTKCQIELEKCRKDYDEKKKTYEWDTVPGKRFTDYIGMDEAGALEDEYKCMQRARHYYQKCGNTSADGNVTATYTRTNRSFSYPAQTYPSSTERYFKDLNDKDEKVSTTYWKDKEVKAKEELRVKADVRRRRKEEDKEQKEKVDEAAAKKAAAEKALKIAREKAAALKKKVSGLMGKVKKVVKGIGKKIGKLIKKKKKKMMATTETESMSDDEDEVLINLQSKVTQQEVADATLVIGMFNRLRQSSLIDDDMEEKLGGYVALLKSGAYVALGTTEAKKNLVHQLKDLREIKAKEQAASDSMWHEYLEASEKFFSEYNAGIAAQKRYQDTLISDIVDRRASINTMVSEIRIKWKGVYENEKKMHTTIKNCEFKRDLFKNTANITEDELLNVTRLRSVLRVFATGKPPVCAQNCDPSGGACVYKTQYEEGTKCACEFNRFGNRCEFFKCEGFQVQGAEEKTLYAKSESGVCSNRGKCDPEKGTCTCSEKFYHGARKACENKWCPGYSLRSGNDLLYSGRKTYNQGAACIGFRGRCDIVRGTCTCDDKYHGHDCGYKRCFGSDGIRYNKTSRAACDGKGACRNGKCYCQAPNYGSTCRYAQCPGNCSGRGRCNTATGRCSCFEGHSGRKCQFVSCKDNCGGPSAGTCNRVTGRCNCKFGYSGNTCKRASRCKSYNANWWTSFDKQGWSSCRYGTLLNGVWRNVPECTGLYCLEMAACSYPCETRGETEVIIKLDNCLIQSWWNTLEGRGWAKCPDNFYLQGLYRSSGNSLYNIELGMCCNIKGATWQECRTADWTMRMRKRGWANAHTHQFVAGLRRGRGHDLKDLDGAHSCGFRRQSHWELE